MTTPDLQLHSNRECVYRIFDVAGNLLYVGASANCTQRMESHRLASGWWPDAHVVTHQEILKPQDMFDVEREAIRAELPRFNFRDNPGRVKKQKQTTNSDWLTTKDAAGRLGITLRTLYRLIDEGQLPAYKMGRVIRLRPTEVDAFLKQARVKPGDLKHLYPDSPVLEES